MVRKYGKANHRNHVSRVAPGTLAAMSKMFGISSSDFMAAVYGDHAAIKKLADMGRLSEVAKNNLEPALAAAKLSIETTGDINKAMSELVKQSAASGKQTTDAILSSQLTEKKFKNQLIETKEKYVGDVSAETVRHHQHSNLTRINQSTLRKMALAQYRKDMQKEKVRIPAAQQKVDIAYDKEVSKQLWDLGSEANRKHIPKTNYGGGGSSPVNGVLGKIKNWMGL